MFLIRCLRSPADDVNRQASATLFPVGYCITKHIGKSLNAIVDNTSEPIVAWQGKLYQKAVPRLIWRADNVKKDLPQILDLISTSPTSTYTRRTTYIQTSPCPSASLSSTLHISRAADLFAGHISALDPRLLLVRREYQTFKMLPDSGAAVMSTKTELKNLKDLDDREKEDLMVEIWAWDEEEAVFKGRELWITSVKGFCEGGLWRRDDRTVVSGC